MGSDEREALLSSEIRASSTPCLLLFGTSVCVCILEFVSCRQVSSTRVTIPEFNLHFKAKLAFATCLGSFVSLFPSLLGADFRGVYADSYQRPRC